MQPYILTISLLLIAAVAAAFFMVVRTSVQTDGGEGARAGAEKIRSGLFWFLIVLGVVVTFASLRPWPHSTSAEATVLNVTGSMWSWEIDKKVVPAGTPIVFRVTSNDVNHGFGVADTGGTILFQTRGCPDTSIRFSTRFRRQEPIGSFAWSIAVSLTTPCGTRSKSLQNSARQQNPCRNHQPFDRRSLPKRQSELRWPLAGS